MMRVSIVIADNRLECDGDVAVADVLALVTQFFANLPVPLDEESLRTLTALLTQSTTALATAMRNAATTTTITTGVTDAQTDSR
jgi:hypothetical protein